MRQNKVKLKNIGENYSIEEINKSLIRNPTILRKEKKKDISSIHIFEKKIIGSHTKGLFKIINNPELIGIVNQFYHAEHEPQYYNGSQQKKSADIYIETKDAKYIIEFKCNDHEKNRICAANQLISSKDHLEKNNDFKIDKMLYVYGKRLITYELTPKGFEFFYSSTAK